MPTDASTVVSYLVGGLLTLLWLAALVEAWRMPDAAFGSQRERAVVLVAMVLLGWVTALVWFLWYRRQLQDELNRKSSVDL
jgi:type VI protein secretion system component VasK